jgi:hypothetical protein
MEAIAQWYDFFGTPGGALTAWGLFSRGLGLVYLVALGSLTWQLVPIAGRRGITPMRDQLRKYRAHYGRMAYWWWPTLYWLADSDAALVAVPALGALAGVGAALGGPWSPACLLLSWAAWLSVSNGAYELIFPWDSFLCELGFLSVWLPATQPLFRVVSAAAGSGTPGGLALAFNSVAAAAAPTPLLAWCYRWLVWRLLVGFGKLKFLGTSRRDKHYIKGFLINQPMLSVLGWWGHKLPVAVHMGALAGMFLIEIPLPFAMFWTGVPRVVAALGIIGLMAGIQVSD